MALNIPNVGQPGDAFLKGLDSGSNMFAKMMNARYNNSIHPSGDVANAMYVEQLKQQFGENDPRYLQAKAAHDMQLSSRQSLMDYRTQLSNLAPYRATSPLGRSINEGRGQGALDIYGPGGHSGRSIVEGENGRQLSPEEAEAYERDIGKKTTDAAIRNKIPYAQNVKITMDSINPDALVHYSGPEGTINYWKDSIKAGLGSPSQEFLNHQEALTSAKTLSKQLRQFWGDSIQPSATDKIDQLTNPSFWNKNPIVAKQQFEQLKKITDLELQSFTKSGTSPIKLGYKDGKFVTKNDSSSSKTNNMSHNNMENDFLRSIEPKLLNMSPNYTSENIKHTAQSRGISVEDVVKQLLSRQRGQ